MMNHNLELSTLRYSRDGDVICGTQDGGSVLLTPSHPLWRMVDLEKVKPYEQTNSEKLQADRDQAVLVLAGTDSKLSRAKLEDNNGTYARNLIAYREGLREFIRGDTDSMPDAPLWKSGSSTEVISNVPLVMFKDMEERIKRLEDIVYKGSVSSFITSQIQDDESYEDAKLRINDEFDYLNAKGKDNPLGGDEYARYKELTKGLGKT